MFIRLDNNLNGRGHAVVADIAKAFNCGAFPQVGSLTVEVFDEDENFTSEHVIETLQKLFPKDYVFQAAPDKFTVI